MTKEPTEHYSTKLKNQVAERDEIISQKNDALVELMKHLMSAKFHSRNELDGYISTSDVLQTAAEIRDIGGH